MLNTRNVPGANTLDPAAIINNEYNNAAGSKKVSEVGRLLLPFPWNNSGTIAYTTNLTTALPTPKLGMNLAVYNNSGTVAAITLYPPGLTPTPLAAGATNATGQVGIPCMANAWTYIATGTDSIVVASSANLLVFLIADHSQLVNQMPAQTPNY